MNDRKTQHQLRARLVREGTRTLAASALTDYRAAKPTFTVAPSDPDSAEAALDALVDSLAETSPSRGRAEAGAAVSEGFMAGLARAAGREPSAYAEAVDRATTPKPLPKPDTRAGLLARLNARHQH